MKAALRSFDERSVRAEASRRAVFDVDVRQQPNASEQKRHQPQALT
jgi:hypothetical protein